MTRNTSATSIKHDHLLRWGGLKCVLPRESPQRQLLYVGRRETPCLSVVRQHPRVHNEMTDRKGVLPSHYESKLVISACSAVYLYVPARGFVIRAWRERKQSSVPGGGRAIAASSAREHRGIHFQRARACQQGWRGLLHRRGNAGGR